MLGSSRQATLEGCASLYEQDSWETGLFGIELPPGGRNDGVFPLRKAPRPAGHPNHDEAKNLAQPPFAFPYWQKIPTPFLSPRSTRRCRPSSTGTPPPDHCRGCPSPHNTDKPATRPYRPGHSAQRNPLIPRCLRDPREKRFAPNRPVRRLLRRPWPKKTKRLSRMIKEGSLDPATEHSRPIVQFQGVACSRSSKSVPWHARVFEGGARIGDVGNPRQENRRR